MDLIKKDTYAQSARPDSGPDPTTQLYASGASTVDVIDEALDMG